MGIIYKTGNVVDALLDGEVDFIAHCCNAQGVMGSGIAKEIKERIPNAYLAYRKHYEMLQERRTLKHFLGDCVEGGRVLNLVGQEFYGYDKKRYVNYGALASALSHCYHVIQFEVDKELPIYPPNITIGIPYKMASDRAGGDWNIVLELVGHLVVPYVKDVIIYQMEK